VIVRCGMIVVALDGAGAFAGVGIVGADGELCASLRAGEEYRRRRMPDGSRRWVVEAVSK